MPTHRSPARARQLALLGVPILVLATVGCSDSSDDVARDASTTTADAAPTTTTTTTAPAVEVDQTPPLGANGIKVGEKVGGEDTLWIASLGSDVVLQVDSSTGRILRRIDAPAASGPDDVAVAEDGTVYWTGFLSGAVGAIAPGEVRTTVVANVGSGANPIALRDDGTLVVGRAGAATGLFSVDPSGDTEPVPLGDPGNVNSFDITPDGLLYAPSLDSSSVLEIDADTGETLRTVATLEGAPIALRWHEDQIYVLVLSDSTRVVRVDPASGATELFAETGLPAADNLAVGEDGSVYVSGLSVPTVTVIGPDGQVERTIQVGG